MRTTRPGRLLLSLILVLAAVVRPAQAPAQHGERTARVGFLGDPARLPSSDALGPFRVGLRERGWIEGGISRPADLPVERPSRLQLALNLRTARALGLTLPPSMLVRADTTFE